MDRGRSPGDRLAVLRGRQPRPDLVGLAGPQARGRDLGRLVLEQVEPAGQLARVDRELGQGRAVGPPALDASAIAARARSVTAERVEQVALPALVEQALLVVLAVDLDERPDLVGEARGGRRHVVEPRGGAAPGRRPRGRR